MSPPPTQPPLSLAALPSGRPGPGEGDAMAQQVERSPPSECLAHSLIGPKVVVQEELHRRSPKGRRTTSWVWRRSRDCQGQRHLLEPKPSPWDSAYPTTAKALNLETPGIGGLLCNWVFCQACALQHYSSPGRGHTCLDKKPVASAGCPGNSRVELTTNLTGLDGRHTPT